MAIISEAREAGGSGVPFCAVAHFMGSQYVGAAILGLAPQALCLRLLSQAKTGFMLTPASQAKTGFMLTPVSQAKN